jgi:cytochrome P450
MDVVKETNHHVKMLLSRVTPALPSLLGDLMARVQDTITDTLPQSSEEWQAIEPVHKVVHLISKAVTLTTFGAPICDDPALVRLCYEHTLNSGLDRTPLLDHMLTVLLVFSIMFVMRLIPRFLQPVLVWLTPFKWRLGRSWKRLEGFVIPDVQYRTQDIATRCVNTDLISCMIREASTEEERDPFMLTRLVGSVIAGGTYSSAAFIVGVIADLVNHPEYLKDIQEEIRQVHEEVQGKWDMTAFNRLDKLDSAMKETSRLAPGSLLVYSRYIEQDCVLSSGLQLKKGQFITTSGHSIAMDSEVFPDPRQYDALRSFRNLERHRAQPFRSVEGDDHRWGAGRWACPGRFIASIVSKIILVKLLDEYEFAFIGNQRPATQVMHEFVFMSPNAKMLVRRKKKIVGISY